MIRLFFGSPGSGKTTLAMYLFHKNQKKRNSPYRYYFSNFKNDLSRCVSLAGLGSWTFPECSYIVVDEAGIEYNNRQFKTLPKETIAWFKLHRHYRCDVDFISQSWEDTDVTIRRLADELWYIRKIGPISMVRRVYRSVNVDETTHQIIDQFRFGKIIRRFLPFPFGTKTFFFIWRPKYYKYFDTFDHPATHVSYADSPYERPARKPISLYWHSFRRCIGERLGRGYRAAHNLSRRIFSKFKR